MKKNSIVFKLFTITSIFFILFITASLVLQSMFFEKFYVNKKTKLLKQNIETFKSGYVKAKKDFIDSKRSLYLFEEKNNTNVAIISKEGSIKFMIGNTENRTDIPKINAMLTLISYYTTSTDYYSVLQDKKTVVWNFQDPNVNTKSLVIVSPIVYNGNVDEVIFAISPLQPIGEAAFIIKEYYIYIYGAAIIGIVLLSLLYSNMISKPLIKLSTSASKMAEFDFSVKCEAHSKDELGNLGMALNTLSGRLGLTLSELKNANEQLRADLQKEKGLEKMRKEFVAGVSHELKTPISLIQGYAEGLKDDIVQGEDRAFYAGIIIEEAQKMSSLVSDMLDLSQLESGNFKLNLQAFYIDELLSYILKKYSTLIQAKQIQIQTEIPELDKRVYGDSLRIEQVITNFLNNAFIHTKEKGTILLSVKDQGATVRIEVENEGEPIAESDLIPIWDKFYKVDPSRNRTISGTGLGLAIVKNILTLHHSDFGVTNTKLGVKFYFTLPFQNEE